MFEVSFSNDLDLELGLWAHYGWIIKSFLSFEALWTGLVRPVSLW